jgi:hypothetical protein
MATALMKAVNGAHVSTSQLDPPTAKLIAVSPAMASSLLAQAHANRRISAARVKQLVRVMQSGGWEVNGQAIVLSDQGRVLDGRHRLSAVVASGITIQIMMVIGVSPACLSMDSGRRRSAGDVLGILGHPRPQIVASGARWLWRYQHQQMMSPTIELLDYELPDFLTENPGLLASASWGNLVRRLLPAGLATALHTSMHRVDATLTKSYFLGLAQGLELVADSPIYKVRERLLHEKRELCHVALVETAALMIRGWTSLRSGRGLPQGKFVGGSSQFPVIE